MFGELSKVTEFQFKGWGSALPCLALEAMPFFNVKPHFQSSFLRERKKVRLFKRNSLMRLQIKIDRGEGKKVRKCNYLLPTLIEDEKESTFCVCGTRRIWWVFCKFSTNLAHLSLSLSLSFSLYLLAAGTGVRCHEKRVQRATTARRFVLVADQSQSATCHMGRLKGPFTKNI